MKLIKILLALGLTLGFVFSPWADARPLSALIGRSAMKKILLRDWVRDAATAAQPLRQPRTVHRYLSTARAAQELRRGVAPDRHMTSVARPGRPLSAHAAQQRYGLATRPDFRATLRLPQGFPARTNKVLGSAPGYGEITSPTRLPPAAIRHIVPLR